MFEDAIELRMRLTTPPPAALPKATFIVWKVHWWNTDLFTTTTYVTGTHETCTFYGPEPGVFNPEHPQPPESFMAAVREILTDRAE